MGNRILLLDECGDPSVGINSQLCSSGFVTELFRNLDQGVLRLQDSSQELVVILARPAAAVRQCVAIRRACTSPIIVLLCDIDDGPSNRDDVVSACLDAGATSVLPASLGRRELAARVAATIRSSRRMGSQQYHRRSSELAQLAIDKAGHSVSISGSRLALTRTEFRLLLALARRRGRTAESSELVSEVWGAAADNRHKSLRLHIGQLRKKLEADPKSALTVVNRRGFGYRLAKAAGP
ncbi:MAG: response regulator transcription factor [Chloroflexi bacterium]|nr:response regulator transcription factor [Chloroflexota bacterium]